MVVGACGTILDISFCTWVVSSETWVTKAWMAWLVATICSPRWSSRDELWFRKSLISETLAVSILVSSFCYDKIWTNPNASEVKMFIYNSSYRWTWAGSRLNRVCETVKCCLQVSTNKVQNVRKLQLQEANPPTAELDKDSLTGHRHKH